MFYSVLLIYYLLKWIQLPAFNPVANFINTKVSVIIPARNEAENLPVLLKSLEQQSYFLDFEVIVVDDFSSDNTAAIAASFPFVTCLQLKDYIPEGSINSYKKKAIEIGIANSVGELIVTTDADCFVPKDWLKTIATFYEMYKPQLIVMPVSIDCGPKPIEIFQALDFMSLQGITAAAVQSKMLSMCNGANLAYTRNAFYAVDGFKGIDNIASGDDMLLMYKIARKFSDGIRYLKSKNVIVHTAAVKNIGDFFNQRIRWASKADKYEDKRIFAVLLLVYLLNVLLLAMMVISAVTNNWFLILKFLIAKTFVELLFLFPVAQFFGKQRLLWLFPLAQPFHIIYTVVAGWLGKFGSYKWKERKVK